MEEIGSRGGDGRSRRRRLENRRRRWVVEEEIGGDG